MNDLTQTPEMLIAAMAARARAASAILSATPDGEKAKALKLFGDLGLKSPSPRVRRNEPVKVLHERNDD